MTRYREVGLLAEGGMAIIAQAERDDGCTVVIKRVRPPFCFDAAFLRLFADEGAVHAALDHENIVRLLDRGEDEAGPFLVFEHVDGTDLGIVLEQQHKIDVECALAVAVPLFRALSAAHDAVDENGQPLHVVHRDISPGNVLIACDGAVKLADFGVASFSLKNELTVAGEMKGKFAYMAPEQTRGERVGPRADLFSAGVVLWEALAGQRLFDGPTDADVVAAVRAVDAPALDVAPSLAALVASLLAKDQAARPESARAVSQALAAIVLELGLDEGLSRHAARLARLAPRGELTHRELDSRRHTQRVLDSTSATGVVVVRPARSRSTLPFAAAAIAVVAVAAVAYAARDKSVDDVVTPLPDAPAPISSAPISSAPSSSAPSSSTPSSTTPTTPVAIEPTASAPSAPLTTTPVATHSSALIAVAPKASAPKATGAHTVATPKARPEVAAPSPHAGDVVAAPAVAPASGFGKLTVNAEPWGSVTIDDKLVARETPLRAFAVSAGHHTVVVENPQYGKKTIELDVPVDGDIKKFVDVTKP
ncbi:MAG TPA: serine/threonine-protein kinase [Myxococcota bacterium]|jgi:serine/threonine-protein kinase